LTAVVAGILVNALTLQRERHPSPFFAAPVASIPAPPARVAAKAPAETPLAPPAPTSPALPPARPADLHAASETTSSIRSTDRIAEILRGAAAKDTQRVTAAAQTALVKLGYSVKVDGAAGADTLAALRDFEKEHGLPITTEITPHLVRRLAAANASASR
jgi:peptidoglycan hydrolase-like protein with peptidoglycan-binding domain